MVGHSAILHPFVRVYFDLWHRVQSHDLTRDLLFEDLRQGRRVGYVDGKAQPKEFWEHVSAVPGPSEGAAFYIGMTYDGEPLFEDVHVTDVLPDPIAVRIDAPLHVRLLDMFRSLQALRPSASKRRTPVSTVAKRTRWGAQEERIIAAGNVIYPDDWPMLRPAELQRAIDAAVGAGKLKTVQPPLPKHWVAPLGSCTRVLMKLGKLQSN